MFLLFPPYSPGAPFRLRFSSAIQQLLDSGLITFWMNDVVRTHVTEERQTSKEKGIQTQLTLNTVMYIFVCQIQFDLFLDYIYNNFTSKSIVV